MAPSLDELLASRGKPPAAPSLAALRQAMVVEQRLGSPWRDLAVLAAVTAGLVLAAAGALVASGGTDLAHLASRSWVLLSVFAAAQLAASAALGPRSAWRPWLGAAALLAAGAVCVLSRNAGVPSATPGWVCSVSHLGLDLVPMGVVLVLLRHAAYRPTRALLAGGAVGAVGAMLGELACAQSAWHVAIFHLPVWLLAVGASAVASRLVRPRSFAP